MLTGQPGGSKASFRSEPLSTWTSREVGNVFGVVQVKGGEASMLEPRFGVREEKKNKRGVGGFLDKAKAEQFLKLPSRASLWAHPSLPKESVRKPPSCVGQGLLQPPPSECTLTHAFLHLQLSWPPLSRTPPPGAGCRSRLSGLQARTPDAPPGEPTLRRTRVTW